MTYEIDRMFAITVVYVVLADRVCTCMHTEMGSVSSYRRNRMCVA